MPRGDEFEVVIPVTVRDHTGAGANSAKSNVEKMVNDINSTMRAGATKNRSSVSQIMNGAANDVKIGSTKISNELVTLFDKNNFLIRQMARAIAGNTGYAVAGLAKLALSWQQITAHAERAQSVLGRPIKGRFNIEAVTAELEKVSVKIGSSMEKAVLRAERGLEVANRGLERARSRFRTVTEDINDRAGRFVRDLERKFNIRVDLGFLRQLSALSDEAARHQLVADRFGRQLAQQGIFGSTATTQFYNSVNSASKELEKLESGATRRFQRASEAIVNASQVVDQHSSKVQGLRKEYETFQNSVQTVITRMPLLRGEHESLTKALAAQEARLWSLRAAQEAYAASEKATLNASVLGRRDIRTQLSPRGPMIGDVPSPGYFQAQTRGIRERGLYGMNAQAVREAEKEYDKLQGKLKDVEKEAAAYGMSMEDLVGKQAGAASAAGALATGLGVVGTAAVAVIAVLAALAIAYGVAIAAAYKLTSAAAANADEIHKAQLETGFSAQTLSVYRLAAQNAGVTFNVVTRAIAEFNKNVSLAKRGYGELGPVFTAAGVDMKAAIANPESEFIKLTERMNDTNISASKYAAIQQIVGRGGYEFAAAMAEVGSSFDEARKRAEALGLQLSESDLKNFHEFEIAVKGVHQALSGLVLTMGREFGPEFTRILREITALMEENRDTTRSFGKYGAESIREFGSAIYGVGVAWRWLTGNIDNFALVLQPVLGLMLKSEVITKDINDLLAEGGEWWQFWGDQALMAINPVLGLLRQVYHYLQNLDTRPKLGSVEDTGMFDMLDTLNQGLGITGNRDLDLPNKPGGKKGAKSELDRLTEQYKKLREELDALYDTTSKEYDLKFKVEDLSKVKSDLETILKLRHELGIDVREPLPAFSKDADESTQRQQMDSIQAVIRDLNRSKQVREDIIKVQEEQLDAESKLLVLKKTQSIPVVNEETRYQTKYLESIRARANAETDLTAELRFQTQLRKDILADDVGRTKKAYETLRLDVIKELNQLDESIRENEVLAKVLQGGEIDIEATFKDQSANRPKSEIAQLTTVASNISDNVRRIAEKVTGSYTPPPAGSTGAGVSVDAAGRSADQAVITPEMEAARRRDGAVVVTTMSSGNGGATGAVYADSRLVPQGAQEDADAANYSESVKVDINQAEWMTKDLLLLRERKRAYDDLGKASNKASLEIIANEARLHQQLLAYDLDLALARSRASVEREQQARKTAINIELTEDQLRRIEQEDVETISQMWAEADLKRREDRIALKQDIIELESEILHNGEDMADRETRARLQAIRDIQEADNLARESMIESQVKIADATVYHTDRANAKVLEFLANEANITDIAADVQINSFQGLFDGLTSALDSALGKLGSMKRAVVELIVQLLKLFAIQKLFNGGGIAQGSGQQSAGNGLMGILQAMTQRTTSSSLAGQFSLTGGWAGGPSPAGTIAPGIFGVPGLTTLGAGLFDTQSLGLGGSFGSGPASITATQAQQNQWSRLGDLAQTAAAQSIGGNLSGGFGSMFSGLMSAAPMLGMGIGASLGASLGGSSVLGQITGAAGGLILGGVAGVTAQAISLGGLSAGLAASLPMLGIVAPIGAALLIGAYLLGRNATRRKNETDRAALNSDTYTRIIDVLNSARRGRYNSVADAFADFNQIKSDYFARIANYDKKTKDIATRVWNNEFEPVYWPLIQQAVVDSMTREQNLKHMHPEFKTGGVTDASELIRVSPGEGYRLPGSREIVEIPGSYRGYDSEYMYAPRGTRIYRRDEMIKSSQPFLQGGMVGVGNTTEKPTLVIGSIDLYENEDNTISAVIRSRDFKDAVVHTVRKAKKDRKL